MNGWVGKAAEKRQVGLLSSQHDCQSCHGTRAAGVKSSEDWSPGVASKRANKPTNLLMAFQTRSKLHPKRKAISLRMFEASVGRHYKDYYEAIPQKNSRAYQLPARTAL